MTSADPRPKLLILASTYPRWSGDPEPGFVHELAKRLANQFDVTVLCPHAPNALTNERMDGVEVVRYRYAPTRYETLVNDGGIVTNLQRAKWKYLLVPSFILMQMFAAWRLLRTRRMEVIHAHWILPQGLIAAFMVNLTNVRIPFMVTSHGADLYALRGGMLNALKRFVVNRASGVTVVSSAMTGALRAIGADAAKAVVLPMGVDVSERFTPDMTAVRSSDEILFVGRLVEKKGVEYLIRALPAVVAKRPTAYLSIVGFGPEQERLRAQVAELGLSQKVRFHGALPQSELPSLYRRAAVFAAPFVQTSSGDQEGLPVALMEAVACGCPIIAGHVAGLEDLLGDAKAEVCVDSRDTTALANLIIDVLMDPDMAEKRARLMRDVALPRVGWDEVADGYAKILKSCLTDN